MTAHTDKFRNLFGRATNGTVGVATVSIRGFVIDVSITEDHTYDSEVTEYPVESGSTISDNVRPRPTTVSVEGVVSNTPIGDTHDGRLVDGGLSANNDPAGLAGAGDLQNIGNPAADLYQLLLEVYAEREPVTVSTSLDVFDNMVMTHLSIPRNAQTGHAIRFQATFQHIEIVSNKRVRVRTAIRQGGKSGRGTVPVVPIPASVILWRHGAPPGGPRVTRTSRVLYTQHHFYHLLEDRVSNATAQAIDAANNAGNAIAAIGWGAIPPNKEITGLKQLTATELDDFSKDNARDTIAAKGKEPIPDYRNLAPGYNPGQFDGGDSRTIAKGTPFIPPSNFSKNPNKPKKTTTRPKAKVK